MKEDILYYLVFPFSSLDALQINTVTATQVLRLTITDSNEFMRTRNSFYILTVARHRRLLPTSDADDA